MFWGCWYLLRKMRKNKESNEKKQKMYIVYSTIFIFFIIFFSVIFIHFFLIIHFYPKFHYYLGPKYFDYIMYVMLVCYVLAMIIIPYVLIRKGKVKIDGIRYKLDKRNGTARVLPNKYSGDLVIPYSFINPKDGATYRVTGLDDNAFDDCGKLTSVTIPEGVTSISSTTFLDCKALKSVTIPKSVTTIGFNPFSCANLVSIKVISGNPKYDSRGNCNAIIETATNTLLYGCKKTVIPDGVANIGDSAFAYFVDLTSVTIPQSVTSIDEYTFADCENLRDVICLAEQVPTTPDDAFEDTPTSEATLHVPAASVEVYKATAPWSKFKNIVAIN